MKFVNGLHNRLRNKKRINTKDKIVFERQCAHCATRGAYSFKFITPSEKPNENKN